MVLPRVLQRQVLHIAEKSGVMWQDIESALLKKDADKDAKKAATDGAAAVAQALALNDASAARRRGKMMLPAPQVPFYAAVDSCKHACAGSCLVNACSVRSETSRLAAALLSPVCTAESQ